MLRWARCRLPEVKEAGVEHPAPRPGTLSRGPLPTASFRTCGIRPVVFEPLLGGRYLRTLAPTPATWPGAGLAAVVRDRWGGYLSVAVDLVLPRQRPLRIQGQNRQQRRRRGGCL